VFGGKEGEREKLNWTWEGWRGEWSVVSSLKVLIDSLIPKMWSTS
jgi:hypothetical protein